MVSGTSRMALNMIWQYSPSHLRSSRVIVVVACPIPWQVFRRKPQDSLQEEVTKSPVMLSLLTGKLGERSCNPAAVVGTCVRDGTDSKSPFTVIFILSSLNSIRACTSQYRGKSILLSCRGPTQATICHLSPMPLVTSRARAPRC